METRASYALVGAFVLILTAVMVGIAIWFARIQFQDPPTSYYIYFGGDVTGLNVGSPVRYRGVPVGSVNDIRIDPDNLARIRVRIEVERSTPIKTDTVARLGLQGITGIAFIQLSGGTQEAPPLTPREGRDVAVIDSEPSALQRIFERLPEIIERAAVAVDGLAQLFNGRNRDAVTNMIQNLNSLIGALNAQQENIVGALRRGQESLAAMTKLMQSLEERSAQLVGNADAAVSDFRSTMEDIRHTAASFDRTADKLTVLVEENRGPLRDFSQGGLYELSQFIAEARVLVDTLNRVARQFERDPSGYLFGDTQRGFQPQ